jgi:hypothetical protein
VQLEDYPRLRMSDVWQAVKVFNRRERWKA